MLFSLLLSPALAADVLILWDSTTLGVPALQTELSAAGHNVTLSDTVQYDFDGTNPRLDRFDVVIHLNGDTYATDMDEAGQAALVEFVAAGGGFLHQEWNAYCHDEAGTYQLMEDLTLLERDGAGDMEPWTVAAGMESHPVVAHGGLTVSGAGNLGLARVYAEDPSVVVMKTGESDAVVVREWQEGRVLGMAVAGTYAGQDPYDGPFLQLMSDSVEWLGDCDRDDDGFQRGFCGGKDCDDSTGLLTGPTTWYEDLDGDGYGEASTESCAAPGENWVALGDDCDDADATISPAAPEEPWDGVDQDCDGEDLCDADGDGMDADVGDCGGDDCDDEDDEIGPDATDVPNDGVDQDCDGKDRRTAPDAGGGDEEEPGLCGCDSGLGGAGLGAGLVAVALLRRRSRGPGASAPRG